MSTTAAPEKLEFKTELKQLLHLITHSLYSHREIFLRELISNASDAINKIKFDSLDREDLLEGNKDWKIKLIPDKEKQTLTVSDNGIGMDRAAIIDHLGTIAKSGTRAFLEIAQQAQGKAKPELIGQFGVGFYSAFMVADRVTVISRPAGTGSEGVKWESHGQGDFTVEPAEKTTRGTDVILHLKDDAKEFLEQWTLRSLVRKFSDFIEHPIVIDVERTDETTKEKTVSEETLNTRTALWLRSKNEIKPEEYNAFYEQLSHDTEAPARVIHYTAEGKLEFKALLFIPAKKPFSYEWDEPKGLRLYIQRVLIMESCEGLLPPYLRFVSGLVDSADLPLNISRELLQQNPLLERIQKNVVRNVLDGLEALKNTERDKYVAFFKGLGNYLKQGAAQDRANKDKLSDLLLFESLNTDAGQYTTLADYVMKMASEQKDIYYLTGESREMLIGSPLLESFRAKNWDVLLLTDPIDEFAIPQLFEYKGKRLKAVDRGDLDDGEKTGDAPGTERFRALLDFLKAKLEKEVADVRLSKRLKESASCLVADANAMTAHMERLMQRMGRAEEGESKRVLELNADHPAVSALRELHSTKPDDLRIEMYGRLFFEQAAIAEGSKIKDPAGFARRVNELIAKDLSHP